MDMKGKILVSLIASIALSTGAQVVLADEDHDEPKIVGIPLATAVAVGIVGATIIAVAVDDDEVDAGDAGDPGDGSGVPTPPPTTTTPTTTPATTVSTTSTTGT